jgi:hypothetical protein
MRRAKGGEELGWEMSASAVSNNREPDKKTSRPAFDIDQT